MVQFKKHEALSYSGLLVPGAVHLLLEAVYDAHRLLHLHRGAEGPFGARLACSGGVVVVVVVVVVEMVVRLLLLLWRWW